MFAAVSMPTNARRLLPLRTKGNPEHPNDLQGFTPDPNDPMKFFQQPENGNKVGISEVVAFAAPL